MVDRSGGARIVSALLANLAEAYLQPRFSARRILALVQDWRTTVLLFLLALSTQTLLALLSTNILGLGQLPTTSGEVSDTGSSSPLQMALLIAVMVGAAYGFGRLFGGRGSLRSVVVVLGWYGLVTAILVPVEIVWFHQLRLQSDAVMIGEMGAGVPTAPGGSLLIVFGVGLELFALWILANFIAEAHGFRSSFLVLLGILGAVFVFGFGLGLALM